MNRKCDFCGKDYKADKRNLKRGWGLTCSKSCAAYKRESSKDGYDKSRAIKNDIKRAIFSSKKRKKDRPLDFEYGNSIDSFNEPI